MLWFLEIVCTAYLSTCAMAEPTPQVPRYYGTKADCDKAAVVTASLWQPGRGAWSFKCLPITKQ